MTTVTGTYPGYREQIQKLVDQHRELTDEPVLLAVYYAPERDHEDVFLFEVLENYAGNTLEDEGDFLEVLYGSSPAFPMEGRDAMLHIVLANLAEFRRAAEGGTPLFNELRIAMQRERGEVVYVHPEWKSLEEALR